MGVNHFGHFLLTQLLLPVIKENGRIVTHSSCASLMTVDRLPLSVLPESLTTKQHNGWIVYGNTKLANAYMSWELSQRLLESEEPRLQIDSLVRRTPWLHKYQFASRSKHVRVPVRECFCWYECQGWGLTQLAAAAGNEEEEFVEACTPDVMIAPNLAFLATHRPLSWDSMTTLSHLACGKRASKRWD